jgi:hypothetical protein
MVTARPTIARIENEDDFMLPFFGCYYGLVGISSINSTDQKVLLVTLMWSRLPKIHLGKARSLRNFGQSDEWLHFRHAGFEWGQVAQTALGKVGYVETRRFASGEKPAGIVRSRTIQRASRWYSQRQKHPA